VAVIASHVLVELVGAMTGRERRQDFAASLSMGFGVPNADGTDKTEHWLLPSSGSGDAKTHCKRTVCRPLFSKLGRGSPDSAMISRLKCDPIPMPPLQWLWLAGDGFAA
jgi:hypothetical protein